MRFRVFTVTPEQFASWIAGQKMPAHFGAVASPAGAGGTQGATVTTPAGTTAPNQTAQAAAPRVAQQSSGTQAVGGTQPAIPRPTAAQSNPGTQTVNGVAANASFASTGAIASGYIYPRAKIPEYAIPHTPPPGDLKFTAGLTGSAARGKQLVSSPTVPCMGCHTIAGITMALGVLGPNLTHIGSRSTIAAGRYPNTAAYLALWIKNARKMKPDVLMPTLGMDEYDPVLKHKVTAATGGLTDQQIADIVAYLTALK